MAIPENWEAPEWRDLIRRDTGTRGADIKRRKATPKMTPEVEKGSEETTATKRRAGTDVLPGIISRDTERRGGREAEVLKRKGLAPDIMMVRAGLMLEKERQAGPSRIRRRERGQELS